MISFGTLNQLRREIERPKKANIKSKGIVGAPCCGSKTLQRNDESILGQENSLVQLKVFLILLLNLVTGLGQIKVQLENALN